jgi:hypothetical protein
MLMIASTSQPAAKCYIRAHQATPDQVATVFYQLVYPTAVPAQEEVICGSPLYTLFVPYIMIVLTTVPMTTNRLLHNKKKSPTLLLVFQDLILVMISLYYVHGTFIFLFVK